MPNATPVTNNYTSTNGIQKIGSSSTNDGYGPIACSSVRSTSFVQPTPTRNDWPGTEAWPWLTSGPRITASNQKPARSFVLSRLALWLSVVFDTLHDEQCSVHRTGSVSSSTEKGIALTSQIGSRTKDTPGMVYYGSLTYFMPLVRATRPQERAPSRIR